MLDKLTREQFEGLIGQNFRLTGPAGETVDLALVDVAELPAPRRAGRRSAAIPEKVRRAPFSVFFAAKPLVPQGMYFMQHEIFGPEPQEIFIVPIGEAEGSGYEYEAVFT
jgi:hypothetical protein